ncbi:MAG: ankyrin repeat domain-containing protein [Vicinamibacterales bacterium]|nr:ankyrin repeat domain-containing protein [Vicinamibacterales bacterium]MDP7478457.1 ankyrin repeat domain-containing protein [Vicinamibacterales bacterium]HJN45749.1 ankyrin repeat domain-containing protein [Vicinamibacterales bacterium]
MMRVRRASGLLRAAASLVAVGLGIAVSAAGQEAPLADAVERGDAAIVRSLLEQQVDVNAAQGDGATALHWAVYLNDAETTAALIRAGAIVNAANNYGVTPLGLASRNGNATIIQQLVTAGVDPNDPQQAVNASETPLLLAARSGQVDAVEALLDAGAEINAQEAWNGQSALMWAAAEGHVPVVERLIVRGAGIGARSNSGATPLLFATRQGSLPAVRALLAAGADVNEPRPDGATPLLVAVINGHEDLVDLLLEAGADPNVEGGSTRLTVQGVRARPMPLEIRQIGYSERDSETVPRGNIFGKPLQAAVHVANWHISDQFISVNLDRLRVIRSLLAHGADANGRNTMEEPRWSGARYRRHLTGATAFMFAAKVADVEVMRLLLEHGADPTINTEDNITPLMAAAGIAWASNQERASEAQVLEAVQLLVEEQGADVNFVSDIGETAMHAAAYRGANSVVQYLFDKGAELDVVALDGRTPLRVADGVEYGNSFAAHPHTAELLRQLGAREIECPAPCAAAIPEELVRR